MATHVAVHAVVQFNYVELDVCSDRVQLCRQVLAPDERLKADRFRFDIHRNRYIVGRYALRQILADRVRANPVDLSFECGEYGKPRLHSRWPHVEFNLAHSEGQAVIVTTDRPAVGVDVEVLRVIDDCRSLARQVFSEPELAELDRADDSSRAFLNGWTRKEAYVKAIGMGLSAPVREITVSLSSRAALLSTAVPGDRASNWTLIDLQHPSCVVALAIPAHHVDLRWCGWYAVPQVSSPHSDAGTAESANS